MNINKRPSHIEDYLADLHTGQWFGWSDSKNKIYANLIIYDNSKTKPTEQECIDGLAQMQNDFDNAEVSREQAKQSAINKLKALGLTDAEVEAFRK
jgi:hypothetical protein